MKNKIYIYLARLDKKGIKVLTAFEYSNKVYPTRIKDFSSLSLNFEVISKLKKEIEENKMTHDLWVETAESFSSLKESLAKRGYSKLPMHQFTGGIAKIKINEAILITKENTMVKRNSAKK